MAGMDEGWTLDPEAGLQHLKKSKNIVTQIRDVMGHNLPFGGSTNFRQSLCLNWIDIIQQFFLFSCWSRC